MFEKKHVEKNMEEVRIVKISEKRDGIWVDEKFIDPEDRRRVEDVVYNKIIKPLYERRNK